MRHSLARPRPSELRETLKQHKHFARNDCNRPETFTLGCLHPESLRYGWSLLLILRKKDDDLKLGGGNGHPKRDSSHERWKPGIAHCRDLSQKHQHWIK
ncbi:hypothetical protein TcasGA2_TC001117 [Tribolium castaneum]|uniref:Uncharacterized protein n=1 Tax=Tribolium castaneum TaxID=7070 RepID=D6WA91_TRICA|nr:hypothetical protein TcasGA2_TC001117 [Tribolium castaneum]